jgi:invasion protein IalB
MTWRRHGQAFRVRPLLAVALLFTVIPIAGAGAQDKKPAPKANTAKQAPGWSVRCDDAGKGLRCRAMQSIVLAKTRQLLLSVAVSKPAKSKNGTMLLHLPHGLYNPAGVTVAVDAAKPEALQIQTCDAKGCYAGTALTPDKLAAFTKGTKLNVVFEDLKKQKITVPVPLKGFDEAFKKL